MTRRTRVPVAATAAALLLAGCAASGAGSARTSDPSAGAPAPTTAPAAPAIDRSNLPALPDGDPGARVRSVGHRAELQAMLDPLGVTLADQVDLPGTDADAFLVEVPGSDAVDAWEDLRAIVPDTGRYPVVVGGATADEFQATGLDQTLDGGQAAEDGGTTVADVLDAADAIDVDAWMAERRSYLEITDDELAVDPPLDHFGGPTTLSSVQDLDGSPLETVQIVLLPTSIGWEAPAYLLWGGWNDVPLPEEHVAVMRQWNEDAGAEVFAMTGDVVEMIVSDPPEGDDAVIDLATEQFTYAPDIVWQGTDDLATLAGAIAGRPAWYFWWD